MMMSLFLRRATFLLVVLGVAAPAYADWINLTGAETSPNIAEIYVLDDHVKLVLEVYIGDLDKFEDLVPDEWLKDVAAERPGAEARIKRFAEQAFSSLLKAAKNYPHNCSWWNPGCARIASRRLPV